jgi:hypothetical protein
METRTASSSHQGKVLRRGTRKVRYGLGITEEEARESVRRDSKAMQRMR